MDGKEKKTGAGQEKTDSGQEERIFTQSEQNAILGKRVSEINGKYADYDSLKEKAEKFDAYEEKNKTELEKSQEKNKALQAELDKLKKQNKINAAKAKVAKETGVPEDMLFGETEEEYKAQADRILKFAKPDSYPDVKDGGESAGQGGKSDAQLFGDFIEKNF